MEEKLDPIFHADSYGYRPGKSAHDALKQCAIRCWRYSWILEVGISAFFDHVRHDLVLKALEHHGSPKMRSLPFDFGIRFSSTGGGNHVPEHNRFQILYRLPSRCWSNIFKVCPSHPGTPLLRRTSRYDAQSSVFGISNDFRCISYVIPF